MTDIITNITAFKKNMELLQEVMKSKGYSQKEFADALGVARSTPSSWIARAKISATNLTNVVSLARKHLNDQITKNDFLHKEISGAPDLQLQVNEQNEIFLTSPEKRLIFKIRAMQPANRTAFTKFIEDVKL